AAICAAGRRLASAGIFYSERFSRIRRRARRPPDGHVAHMERTSFRKSFAIAHGCVRHRGWAGLCARLRILVYGFPSDSARSRRSRSESLRRNTIDWRGDQALLPSAGRASWTGRSGAVSVESRRAIRPGTPSFTRALLWPWIAWAGRDGDAG